MEISKENVFKVEYTSVLGQEFTKKERRTSKIINFISNNKLITATIIIFLMCFTLNFVLIYNFMKLLENL